MSTDTHEKHDGHGKGRQGEAPPSAWEWFTAAIGLLLLLSTLGYLLFETARHDDAAPVPELRVTAIEQQQGRYVVRVEVANRSRATAAALRVEGELRRGSELVERSEMEFQHVPGRSTRHGGLFFTQDPRALQLQLSARSYQKP